VYGGLLGPSLIRPPARAGPAGAPAVRAGLRVRGRGQTRRRPAPGAPRRSPPAGTTSSPRNCGKSGSEPSTTWDSSASTTAAPTPTGGDHRIQGRPEPAPDGFAHLENWRVLGKYEPTPPGRPPWSGLCWSSRTAKSPDDRRSSPKSPANDQHEHPGAHAHEPRDQQLHLAHHSVSCHIYRWVT
jgi:hypothetical protein